MENNVYHSQYEQDRFLNEKIFRNKRGGFFVEVGAHNGVSFSNTYFFEKNLGWKGICIEPNPDRYIDLCKNRKSLNLNLCISRNVKVVDFTLISGYAEMLSGITDKYDPKHVEWIDNAIKEKGGEKRTIKVESVPLAKIFADNNVNYIDYMSIDVEGGEMEVLESIDFEATHIQYFSVENNYKSKEIKSFLKSKQFSLIKRISCDEIYGFRKKKFLFFLNNPNGAKGSIL